MRLMLTLSTLAVIALSSAAVADSKPVVVQPASTSHAAVPVAQVSQSRVGFLQPMRRQGQGVFGRIMEVERRKNAWLRRTFLN